ncbi:LysR family transcriptional regulator [Bailinhaonella thermotolerans]|uniref:LysR family transcriptional regulator n=1 Tax=Bailinhaonella thermotolerans TaxID=1070861 RepID=A0A3A4AAI6_9ACTN|nr:LysR family transcriptional regulator [Bailinhaonella thermotolerans]RJL23060.1 LysR family transcriptional regulator [Bailinhaonella thermotolerans]
MDTHLLRTFVTVARLGSFSAAAAELGYTQSAVSQHIAALEADLKTPLLGRRPVAPTEAGARLLDHAGPILLRLAAARTDLARLVRTPPERLLVAASPGAFGTAAARALAVAAAANPRARTGVRLLAREAVAGQVAAGEVDAGLVSGVAAPTDPLPGVGGVEARRVSEDPLAVLLPAGHPLATRPGLDLTTLADARWIDAPACPAPLADLRAAAGPGAFPPGPVFEGADPAVLAALVAAGHGLTLLPLPAATGFPGTTAVPLTSPRLVHRVELLLCGTPTPTTGTFTQTLTTPPP